MMTEFQIRATVRQRLNNPSLEFLHSLRALGRANQCGTHTAWRVYENALYAAVAAEARQGT
ncbi:MAG: hypothetical protein FJ318_08105 [SAR202 cluster bacterium]|nr:hypothetical protein [SAR202 cluster bacterium]